MTLKELLYNIVFQPAYAAALEIEDSVIRIAHAAPKRRSITLVHEHPLTEGVIGNGEILNEREFAAALSEAIATSGLRSSYYVTHTPARHTALRLLQFPPMPARELRDAVRYEAARNLPYTLAEAAIGYARLDDVITPTSSAPAPKTRAPRRSLLTRKRASDDQASANDAAGDTPSGDAPAPAGKRGRKDAPAAPAQLLVAATPNAHVLTLMRVARAVGIRLGVVEPKALASLRALNHHHLIRPNDLILDIHTHHAHINAITNGSLKLNRLLSYQRHDLSHGSSDELADSLTRDLTSTLEYLTRIDDTILMRRLLAVGGTLSEPLTRIINDLGLELEYATIPERPPEQISIIGLALRGAGGI